VSTTSQTVTNIVKFIESTPSIPVNTIKTIIHAEKTTTIYGIEVVTIEAITDKNIKIKTVVSYNPVTQISTISDFVVLEQPTITVNTTTEFTVDVLTGAKLTITNNPTVIASSTILQSISATVISTQHNTNLVMTESSSTEYQDSIKVVSIFVDQTSHQATQVVSFFDKTTSTVQVVDSRPTVTLTTEIKKEVYTASEVTTLKTQSTEISKVITTIETAFPRYVNQKVDTIIVETLGQVDIVTTIFKTSETVKNQVVAVYNKTTHVATVV
jgi:hypothetical protein